MKRLISILLCMCFLSGCTGISNLENQAHVVSMGIDYKNGIVKISVQVPSFGGSGAKEENKDSGSYQVYTASAKNFSDAYAVLRASVPQKINVSHLKSIIFSKELAESGIFRDTVENLMQMFPHSGNAVAAVCLDEASRIIDNQKPYIGLRLSEILPAMLEYRKETGMIPYSTLSMLYAGMKSVYSTPLIALCAVNEDQAERTDDNAFLPGNVQRTGMNKNEYAGSSVFTRNKMEGILNGQETQLAYLIKGEKLREMYLAEPYGFSVNDVKTETELWIKENGHVQIELKSWLKVSSSVLDFDTVKAEKMLEKDMEALIKKCGDLGADPFGFSEIAAGRFMTMHEYTVFDWLKRFGDAVIYADVQIVAENIDKTT